MNYADYIQNNITIKGRLVMETLWNKSSMGNGKAREIQRIDNDQTCWNLV